MHMHMHMHTLGAVLEYAYSIDTPTSSSTVLALTVSYAYIWCKTDVTPHPACKLSEFINTIYNIDTLVVHVLYESIHQADTSKILTPTASAPRPPPPPKSSRHAPDRRQVPPLPGPHARRTPVSATATATAHHPRQERLRGHGRRRVVHAAHGDEIGESLAPDPEGRGRIIRRSHS